MAAEEFECALYWYRRKGWDLVGRVYIQVDLRSLPSKVNALLVAMEQFRKPSSNIEQYELRLFDSQGINFTSLRASYDQLQEHLAGYPVNVADPPAVPWELGSFSDEQLVTELHRRLRAHAEESSAGPLVQP
jgi:hypothetical protein